MFISILISCFIATNRVTIRVIIRDYEDDMTIIDPIILTDDDTVIDTAFAAEAELEAKLLQFEETIKFREIDQFNQKDQVLWDELVSDASDDTVLMENELQELNEFLADVNVFGDDVLEGSASDNNTILVTHIVSIENRMNSTDNLIPIITEPFTMTSVTTNLVTAIPATTESVGTTLETIKPSTAELISHPPTEVMVNYGIVESLKTIAEILEMLVNKLAESENIEPVFDKQIDTSSIGRSSSSWHLIFCLICLLLQ